MNTVVSAGSDAALSGLYERPVIPVYMYPACLALCLAFTRENGGHSLHYIVLVPPVQAKAPAPTKVSLEMNMLA